MPTFSQLIGNRIETEIAFPGDALHVSYFPQVYTAEFEAAMVEAAKQDPTDITGLKALVGMLVQLLAGWDLEWDETNPKHKGNVGVVPIEEWALLLQPGLLLKLVSQHIVGEMQQGKVNGSSSATAPSSASSTAGRLANSPTGTSRSTRRKG